jgi:hypothetical protein
MIFIFHYKNTDVVLRNSEVAVNSVNKKYESNQASVKKCFYDT